MSHKEQTNPHDRFGKARCLLSLPTSFAMLVLVPACASHVLTTSRDTQALLWRGKPGLHLHVMLLMPSTQTQLPGDGAQSCRARLSVAVRLRVWHLVWLGFPSFVSLVYCAMAAQLSLNGCAEVALLGEGLLA